MTTSPELDTAFGPLTPHENLRARLLMQTVVLEHMEAERKIPSTTRLAMLRVRHEGKDRVVLAAMRGLADGQAEIMLLALLLDDALMAEIGEPFEEPTPPNS